MSQPLEEFIPANAERYKELVKRFKPEPVKHAPANAVSSQDNVVCTRVRPLLDEEADANLPSALFLRKNDPGVVDAHDLKHAVRGKPTLRSSVYTVDRTYDQDASSDDIYADAVQHLVPWAWGGGIGTLFAYGQTGSGKTFTVSAIEKMVAKSLMESGLEGDRKVFVSITELAGNTAYDLLNSRRQISVLEDSFGNTQLAGAIETEAKSTADILTAIDTATKYRKTEATQKNDSSSRSHAICRIRIEQHDAEPGTDDGILYLIDLAGSEAARDRTAHTTDRMKESREINTSLSVLKDCIRGKIEADATVSRKKRPYIPFRQSALTKVLKHVFDPNGTRICKNVFMACVNPCLLDLQASRNTLRYAEMLRVFLPQRVEVKYDKNVPMTWTNEELQAYIRSNSGSPPINASILAPTETGAQLLRLPAPDFDARCSHTPNVSKEQAAAFRSKLWQLHIDARQVKATSSATNEGVDTILGFLNSMGRDSSAQAEATGPFKERVRTGMAVAWRPPKGHAASWDNGMKIVVVLCPLAAAGGSSVREFNGEQVPVAGEAGQGAARYVCALVQPAVLPGAYELKMWRQVVVDLDWMEKEVVLEYDSATRFYHLAV